MSYAATASWWFEGGRHYTKQGYLDHAKGWTADAASASLRGRHIAVTGANAGLGFALSKELARRDATVHLVCRNRARGEKALGAAMWEALGALEAPCLLVRGMRSSSVVDDADEAELRARLPTARVERLDAGHSVQGDAPVALAQVIASFLPPSG